jgi:hypothetical protein
MNMITNEPQNNIKEWNHILNKIIYFICQHQILCSNI